MNDIEFNTAVVTISKQLEELKAYHLHPQLQSTADVSSVTIGQTDPDYPVEYSRTNPASPPQVFQTELLTKEVKELRIKYERMLHQHRFKESQISSLQEKLKENQIAIEGISKENKTMAATIKSLEDAKQQKQERSSALELEGLNALMNSLQATHLQEREGTTRLINQRKNDTLIMNRLKVINEEQRQSMLDLQSEKQEYIKAIADQKAVICALQGEGQVAKQKQVQQLARTRKHTEELSALNTELKRERRQVGEANTQLSQLLQENHQLQSDIADSFNAQRKIVKSYEDKLANLRTATNSSSSSSSSPSTSTSTPLGISQQPHLAATSSAIGTDHLPTQSLGYGEPVVALTSVSPPAASASTIQPSSATGTMGASRQNTSQSGLLPASIVESSPQSTVGLESTTSAESKRAATTNTFGPSNFQKVVAANPQAAAQHTAASTLQENTMRPATTAASTATTKRTNIKSGECPLCNEKQFGIMVSKLID